VLDALAGTIGSERASLVKGRTKPLAARCSCRAAGPFSPARAGRCRIEIMVSLPAILFVLFVAQIDGFLLTTSRRASTSPASSQLQSLIRSRQSHAIAMADGG
jgi:hypothetical protein